VLEFHSALCRALLGTNSCNAFVSHSFERRPIQELVLWMIWMVRGVCRGLSGRLNGPAFLFPRRSDLAGCCQGSKGVVRVC
jgi:hypothetical protein